MIINGTKILYSSLGIAMVLSVVGLCEKRRNVEIPAWTVKLGSLCMGVYIFQQFILQAMYYHTIIPSVISPYLLPWIGFIVALVVSLFLAWMLRRTKVGRSLIG